MTVTRTKYDGAGYDFESKRIDLFFIERKKTVTCINLSRKQARKLLEELQILLER